jgi:serine protease Do
VLFPISALARRVAAAAVVFVLAAAPAALPAPAVAHPAPDGFADLAARLLPAVVNISTSQSLKPKKGDHPGADIPKMPPGTPFDEFFHRFFEEPPSGEARPQLRNATSLGSGFIIDSTGYVVTNNHVIADADEITVILHDNTNLKAELVGRDTKTDIAVLKIKADKPLASVAWGDSEKARVGDWVIAIGNPFGLGGSVTAGILSARQRDINSGPYDDFLQTDAAINRGNSGGPMFNMNGHVIGINTAIYSPSGGSIGIGFAIPSSLAKEVVAELIDEPDHAVHRGWLGVRIQAVTQEIAESLGLDKPRGALVASVADNGPAQAAGIEPGDVVLNFDGKEVSDMRALPRLVAETKVGKKVTVTVWRKRQQKDLIVAVGKLEEQEASAQNPKKGPDEHATLVKTLGLSLSPITADMKEKFSLADDAKGVVVVDVAKNSTAAERGLKPGDVIVEVAQEEVKDPEDMSSRIDELKKSGRKSILLLVDRKGDLRFVALRLDQG